MENIKEYSEFLNENTNRSDEDKIFDISVSNKKLTQIITKPLFKDKWREVYIMDDRVKYHYKTKESDMYISFGIKVENKGTKEELVTLEGFWGVVFDPRRQTGRGQAIVKYKDSSRYKSEYGEYHPNFIKETDKFVAKLEKNTGIKLNITKYGFR